MDIKGRDPIRSNTPNERDENQSFGDELESGSDKESCKQRVPIKNPNESRSKRENGQQKIVPSPKNQQSVWDVLKEYYVVCVLAFVLLSVSVAVAPVYLVTPTTDEKSKICSFDELKSKYPKQNDYAWKSLSVGIENIINERSDAPGVYLFVHNGARSMQKLVHDIAKTSSSCFDHKRHPVEMVSEDFTSEQAIVDYGYAIEKYKMKIKDGNVILIVNLNEIPAQAAPALHTICDTYSPIAKNVVIFLTLIAQENKGNAVEIAENTLYDIWGSKIKSNELGPLITRVTDQVIPLES